MKMNKLAEFVKTPSLCVIITAIQEQLKIVRFITKKEDVNNVMSISCF